MYVFEVVPMWQMWIALAVFLLIVEFFTAGFGVICFSVGCLLSAVMAALGCGMVVQVVAFAVGSLLSFVYVRPVLLRLLESKRTRSMRMNVDTVVGKQARVVQRVGLEQPGRVALEGTDWRAVLTEGSAEAEEGQTVTVIARSGNTLEVQLTD